MEIKKHLRKEMFSKRSKMNPAEKVQSYHHIRSKLEKIVRESDAKVIHAYIPIANELDIAPLLQLLIDEGRTNRLKRPSFPRLLSIGFSYRFLFAAKIGPKRDFAL